MPIIITNHNIIKLLILITAVDALPGSGIMLNVVQHVQKECKFSDINGIITQLRGMYNAAEAHVFNNANDTKNCSGMIICQLFSSYLCM